jgi:iron complex transport system ATP-binding protein
VLQAHQLSFSYSAKIRLQPETFAVRDVSFSVEAGSITGLLGPNGCGKTSLLKLLAGIATPQAGHVTLNGRALTALSRREIARQIAVVPQETHPAFDYTALEMALMGRHPHLGTFQVEGPADVEVALEALAATGTDQLAQRAYATLSGGEKQRVVIAGALAQQPQVLLLDEPTASLDVGYQLDIQSLLIALNRSRGVTMVLATHDLNLAAAMCERLVLLRAGAVIAHGPTADVLTPESIRALYGVQASVATHPATGHLTVVPVRRV